MGKCTREEYVDWVGFVVRSFTDDGWEMVNDVLEREGGLLLDRVCGGGADMEHERRERWGQQDGELWVVVEKVGAGKMCDGALAKGRVPFLKVMVLVQGPGD